MDTDPQPQVPRFLRELNTWLEVRERLALFDTTTFSESIAKVDSIIKSLISSVTISNPGAPQ